MEVMSIVGVCWFTFLIVPVWMVAILCGTCWKGAPTRIASYGDYIDSKQLSQGHTVSSFTVIRASGGPPPMNTQLMPPMVPPESRRTSLLEVRESDNESLPNYENTAKGHSEDDEDDDEADCCKNTNYIVVLPDDVPTTSQTKHRISSGTLTEDYENLKDKQGGSSNYINIDTMGEETERDSDEEEEEEASDYVNSSSCVARR